MRTDERLSVVAITNLYPLPWEPTRATFNKQQFDILGKRVKLKIGILVPLFEWLKHLKEIKNTSDIAYIPYFHIPKFGARLAPFFQYCALKLKSQWLLESKPDVIYSCWLYPDVVASAKFAGEHDIPCVAKAHGTDVNFHLQNIKKSQQLLAQDKSLKHIFCPSQALANKLFAIGFDTAKVSTNYNGVNKAVFYPSDTREQQPLELKKLVFVGSMLKTKGVFELINVYSQIAKQVPSQLTLIGQGADVEGLRALCAKLKLDNAVCFMGPQPLDVVAEHVRAADVLVLPSYREGLPNVVLEAFASGTPVVATKVGGIPEVVTEQTGVLVEAKSEQDLTEGLLKALSRTWSESAIIAHAALFDWEVNVDNVMAQLRNPSTQCNQANDEDLNHAH
jgi:glycosyltransferase involved in cell wall biosynthesis